MSEEDKLKPAPNGESAAPESEADAPRPRVLDQFVVFPLAIVLVGVAVYLMIGMLTVEERSAQDYLNTIRTGGINSRWQAAFDLVKVLAKEQREGRVTPGFARELVRIFEASEHDDPRVQRFLVRAMMMVPDSAVVPALISALDAPDGDTRIYAILSLGAQKDPRSVKPLLRMARDEDPGIRKSAVYALGQYHRPGVHTALVEALTDPAPDVRWNAAVQLAYRKDGSAARVLSHMMDRAFLESVEGMTDAHRETAIIQAVQAVVALGDRSFRTTLVTLREKDPSVKVRQSAIKALEAWSAGLE